MSLNTCFIKRLKLYNYRNYSFANIELKAGVNIFLGKNAQGKTNLIEAISLLSHGKSFRTSKTKELIYFEKLESSVCIELETSIGELNLRCELTKEGRLFFLNDKKIKKISEIIGRLLVVSFTPRDLNLVTDGPQVRRSFIDKLIVQLNPSCFDNYINFNKVLKAKKSLLKKYPANLTELKALNTILARESENLIIKRNETIKLLNESLKKVFAKFCPETINITYKSSLIKDSVPTKEEILKILTELNENEVRQQRTLVGPHLDDIKIEINNKKARDFASQGQTRSIVLALMLASLDLLELKLNIQPVILLDDVSSELDSERTDLFFKLLFDKKRQTLITGTDSSLSFLKELADNSFHIENGEFV